MGSLQNACCHLDITTVSAPTSSMLCALPADQLWQHRTHHSQPVWHQPLHGAPAHAALRHRGARHDGALRLRSGGRRCLGARCHPDRTHHHPAAGAGTQAGAVLGAAPCRQLLMWRQHAPARHVKAGRACMQMCRGVLMPTAGPSVQPHRGCVCVLHVLQKKCTPLLQEVKSFAQTYPAYSAFRGLVRKRGQGAHAV